MAPENPKSSKTPSNSTTIPKTTSKSSLSSTTAIVSESLEQMVQEMESQLNHVLSSLVLDDSHGNLPPVVSEEEDAFKEATEPLSFDEDQEHVKTLDVPRWLSDEQVVHNLQQAIKEKNLEQEYQCSIELFGLETNDTNTNNKHILLTMKGSDRRQLGRVRRSLEDILISYLKKNMPKNMDRKNASRAPSYPPSLGRLLYSFALSETDNSPRWYDRNRHRTVWGRALLPLYSKKKVWMNVVELPKDKNGNHHGKFLAGRGGKLFEFYRERFDCRVDIYGDWSKSNEEGNDEENVSALMCDPYVLVTSKTGKSNVDKCLQFIEHRIKEHSERFEVSRDRDVERLGEQRRRRLQKTEGNNMSRGRSGQHEKMENEQIE